MPKHTNDRLQGTLDLLVLKTLAAQGPMHGYGITLHIERISKVLRLEEGSLYPALQRMLKQGWLKAEWGISSTNRRVRIYKVTPAGAKHLEEQVSSFERMLEGITRVLAPVKP